MVGWISAAHPPIPDNIHAVNFMSNYRRAIIPGGVFFFTVVPHERVPVFTTETRIEALRAAFRKVMVNRPFQIDAMVILPDHLHCIWRLPPNDSDYSGRWREIKKAASNAINTSTNQNHERPLWQRRFWEHAIRGDQDWRNHVDYIHYNPVKHGMASRPGDWPWSSFRKAVSLGWYEPDWGESEPASVAGMDME